MNNNRGFTLIEMLIATVIMLIVSLGFFGWATTIIQANLSAEKINFANTFALDVADRLQRMEDNVLNRGTTGTNKYVGYNTTGDLRGCASGSPTVVISSGATGMITYANPLSAANALYMYDNNNCQGKTWVDAGCGSGITRTASANTSIDHPNAAGSDGSDIYDSVNPVRTFRNSTFYAVWSVAYMPCNAGTNTDKRKIFVTVYWIDPEPSVTTMAVVQTGITAGSYTMKSTSVTVDKSIGVE
jgi:prepilin-type N-terminal cleavage/methylation domain-containing protein